MHPWYTSDQDQREPAISKFLPPFWEKAATQAMIKHGMSIVGQSTLFLYLGQILAIAVDAPLFALAKHIHWKWPETHSEHDFVITLGGLHIDLKFGG